MIDLSNNEVRAQWIADNQKYFRSINWYDTGERSDTNYYESIDKEFGITRHPYTAERDSEGDHDGAYVMMKLTQSDFTFIVGSYDGSYNSYDGEDFYHATYKEFVKRESIVTDYIPFTPKSRREHLEDMLKTIQQLIKDDKQV